MTWYAGPAEYVSSISLRCRHSLPFEVSFLKLRTDEVFQSVIPECPGTFCSAAVAVQDFSKGPSPFLPCLAVRGCLKHQRLEVVQGMCESGLRGGAFLKFVPQGPELRGQVVRKPGIQTLCRRKFSLPLCPETFRVVSERPPSEGQYRLRHILTAAAP